jgi:hypothetical protein
MTGGKKDAKTIDLEGVKHESTLSTQIITYHSKGVGEAMRVYRVMIGVENKGKQDEEGHEDGYDRVEERGAGEVLRRSRVEE